MATMKSVVTVVLVACGVLPMLARAAVLEGVAGAVPRSGLVFARRLTDAERVYFGKVVADVVRASAPRCPPDRVELDDPPSLEKPASLVPREAQLAQGGAFPNWRLGVSLICSPGRDGEQASVSPSPEPLDVASRPKRVIEQRSGYVLFVHEWDVAAVAIDVPATPASVAPSSAVRPIRSVELRFYSKNLDAGLEAARRVDVAAVQAALATGYPPPVGSGGCATGSGEQPASAGDPNQEEAAVYEAVIGEQLKRGPKGQVIAEASDTLRVDQGNQQEILRASPCLQPETLADFSARAGKEEPLPAKWLRKAGFVVTSDAQRAKALGESGMSWKRFKITFPGSNGIVHFSRVGFNAARTQAMVYMGWTAGQVLGSGEVYVLERVDGRWRTLYVAHLWVS